MLLSLGGNSDSQGPQLPLKLPSPKLRPLLAHFPLRKWAVEFLLHRLSGCAQTVLWSLGLFPLRSGPHEKQQLIPGQHILWILWREEKQKQVTPPLPKTCYSSLRAGVSLLAELVNVTYDLMLPKPMDWTHSVSFFTWPLCTVWQC